MTWTLIQKSAAEAAATALTVTPALPGASTSGNLLVCTVVLGSGTFTLSLPAGWVQGPVMTSNGAAHTEIWYYIANPGAISSVVVTSSSSVNMKAALAEFHTDVAGATVVANAQGTAKAGTVASLAVPTTTAAAAGDLAVCAFIEHFVTASAITWTNPAGFTLIQSDTASAGNHLYGGYNLSVAAGTLTVTGTSSVASDSANGFSGAVLTFSAQAITTGNPYHVGSAAPTASSATTVVTPVTATTMGDAIIVATAATGTTASVTSVTDTRSNTYTSLNRYAAGSYVIELWIAAGAAALATSDTITAFWSASATTHRMDVMGCPGVASAAAADPNGIAAANSAGSTSPSTGATGTLQNSGELAIAVCAYGSGGGTITWGNSYNAMASVQAGATEFLATAWKSLSTTAATTASGTITSQAWTIMVVTLAAAPAAGPFIWYDGTPSGWIALQATVPDPPMFSYGLAGWTASQIASLPADTIKMPNDTTGAHPATSTIIDVESSFVTSVSVIASWINARLALPGGYAANRPTVYLARNGLFYVGASSDVITPLASTYNLHLGRDYDLWIAQATGTQPSSPVVTLGVPCVATQFKNYAQTGSSYDVNIAFDSTWVAAFGGSVSTPVNLGSVITTNVNPTESLTAGAAVVITGGGAGPAANGWPQLILEAALTPAAPVAKLGTFILDDPVYGRLDSGWLGDTSVFTDITAYLISLDVTRPSTRVQGPLLTYQAGTLTAVLDNSDGRFDPGNGASPYMVAGSGVRIMLPVRLRAILGGAEYPLWYGYIDGWEPGLVDYEGGYAELTMTATDGFKVLAGVTVPAVAPPVGDGETSGARVHRILTAGGWYTDHRKIAAGDSQVQATGFGDTALNLLQLTADTEIGELYQDGAGYIVFRNRHAILTDTRSAAPQAVFGDLPGTIH